MHGSFVFHLLETIQYQNQYKYIQVQSACGAGPWRTQRLHSHPSNPWDWCRSTKPFRPSRLRPAPFREAEPSKAVKGHPGLRSLRGSLDGQPVRSETVGRFKWEPSLCSDVKPSFSGTSRCGCRTDLHMLYASGSVNGHTFDVWGAVTSRREGKTMTDHRHHPGDGRS